MSKDASFDVVSEFDKQELVNAVDQAKREIDTRFDLKDSGSKLELQPDHKLITITTTDEFRIRNILDILENKLIKRGLNVAILDPQTVEHALGGNVRQPIKLKEGIDKDLAKRIVASIKDTKLKVQASIQGEQVRVTGKSRDDLQTVIAHLNEKAAEWSVPLQFTNYR
ncbi:MAG: YajQ family cyclic di-GMP-binding protein [Cyanobacteria bacterium HKST-UBA06]|nr:YajQ family cyclic di-GMP-binding protein [Cyanobacteria bacterium HKST-UBA04]MCA9806490.1 YajQ family cyclic di-GMP-binding protein [Cyanobacteria bacterium HKST-UBA06]MCA9841748.1 YajQ family cyclic di-GMP-binding protein [Cyanobacteria bacterium HKST-UBA03]